MRNRQTLLLSASDVTGLLDMPECIDAVERGLRLLGEGKIPPAEILGVHAPDGGLHIKAALWQDQKSYFVAKANANFPMNPKRHGLPTIQGVLILSDAATGELLAIMDSIEITALRTAAASAVAAKYLARPESQTLTICGAGKQGLAHLDALAAVLPLKKVHICDPDDSACTRFIRLAGDRFTGEIIATSDFSSATLSSDVIATCTTSRQALLMSTQVRPGTFIAAVGADNEHKQEIDPLIFCKSKVVVDSLDQCSKIGDLHHAMAASAITKDSVHAELAAVVAKFRPGRETADEVILFDSTGIAVEDAAAATVLYEKAAKLHKYRTINLNEL